MLYRKPTWSERATANRPSLVRFAGFILDLDACTSLAREIRRGDPPRHAASSRYLRAFAARPGRVVRQDALLDALRQPAIFPGDPAASSRRSGRATAPARSKPTPRNRDSSSPIPGEGYRFDGLAEDC